MAELITNRMHSYERMRKILIETANAWKPLSINYLHRDELHISRSQFYNTLKIMQRAGYLDKHNICGFIHYSINEKYRPMYQGLIYGN